MWYFFCVLLVFHRSNSQIIPTNDTTSNKTIQMERIVQPSAQSQNIETATTPNATENSGFRPSPHLETYLEYNNFPVKPAIPEAKHFSVYNFGETPAAWPEHEFTTEQSRVKFPTISPVTSKERPYEFYKGNNKGSSGKAYSPPEDWNKYQEYEKKQHLVHKHQFDFSAPVERPNYGSKNGFDYGSIEKPHGHAVQGNPWKKIVKFLTAFIPIGLLISALTPTVITVQNVNGTQLRSRALAPSENKYISSLNYFNSIGCEERILCELVLSASASENGEQHVENLLNTFTKEGKAVEKAEEMRRIFEAVKKQDCRPIVCKNIKENT